MRMLQRLIVLFFCCEAVLALRFNPGILYGGLLVAMLTLKQYLLFHLQLPTAGAYTTLLYNGCTAFFCTLILRVTVVRGPLAALLARVICTPGWHRGYKPLRLLGLTDKYTLLLVEPAAMAAFLVHAAMTPVSLRFRPYWHYLGATGQPLPPLPVVARPAWWLDAAPWIALALPGLAVLALYLNNRAEYAGTAHAQAEAQQRQQQADREAVASSGPVLQFPMVKGLR
jgi:hypothetical protein